MESLTIVGRRWFDGNNTYYSAEVVVDGKLVHNITPTSGYGSQYEQDSWDWVVSQGLANPERYSHGSCQQPSRYCRENGIPFHSIVSDVSRKRDL